MTTKKRLPALILALILVFALTGCVNAGDGRETDGSDSSGGPSREPALSGPEDGSGEGQTPTSPDGESDGPTDGPDEPTAPTPGEGALRLGLCADAAAIGAAGLSGNEKYSLVFGTADMAAAFSNGELDAALVPIDAALRIYAATGGKVRLAAVTATGGWKIVERGTVVRDIWGLAEKTVYVPRESAMAVKLLAYVAEGYDFILGDTLVLEEVPTSELASHDLALMPAILAGSTIVKDAESRLALDLGEELENIAGFSLLPVGCLIVGSDMSAGDLEALLTDLRASQDALSDDLDAAVSLKMAASQEEAWAAVNDCCTFVWYTGQEARDKLDGFIDLLYSLDPDLVGGHIPDDGFYT